jgi:septal ring factor EnvC (AmiA/AmiB activator)
MEQIMEFLKADKEEWETIRKADKEEIKINQAKMEAAHKELLAKMEADRKADQERMEAHQREIKEMMKIMNSNHNETLACQETEARQEEMRASRKETATIIEPKTEDNGLPRNGGASRRRGDLSGQETGGSRATRGPRR